MMYLNLLRQFIVYSNNKLKRRIYAKKENQFERQGNIVAAGREVSVKQNGYGDVYQVEQHPHGRLPSSVKCESGHGPAQGPG